MCGFVGIVDAKQSWRAEEYRSVVSRMNERLVHRGPDDAGIWIDENVGVALGHRRLSVIDVSPEGHQPMLSHCGRYVIAYNGEIYNYPDIRDELDAGCENSCSRWRGSSDTEVLLEAISRWGVAGALSRFNGMFAFALWDRKDRALYLVRDRLGEKPLYYGWLGDTLLFGSELKALKAYSQWEGTIDRQALQLLMRHNYIPVPFTIYKDVRKLPPGTMLKISQNKEESGPEPYWSLEGVIERRGRRNHSLDERAAVDELESLLRSSIKMRMRSDVPLGAFLSGGIDSSTVVALMQAQTSTPVKTFTIGFSEQGYDEAVYAKAIANHLGTDHTELYVTPQEAMSVIPSLPELYDEPFSDSSQIPTYLISKLARQHVTVSLSGDGGDELFGGYSRYAIAKRLWSSIGWLPYGVRQRAACVMRRLPPHLLKMAAYMAYPLVRGYVRKDGIRHKLHRLADTMNVRSSDDLYLRMVSHWKDPDALVLESHLVESRNALESISSFTERMMCLDAVTYLPDDILVKVDRASMGVSLEARVPLLDHRIVEYAWNLPLRIRVGGGQGKRLLRNVLNRYVPDRLFERPKMGFGVPLGSWLRGPLRDWAESQLTETRIRNEGYFNAEMVREKWNDHVTGKSNYQYHIWDVLMFQSWLEANG